MPLSPVPFRQRNLITKPGIGFSNRALQIPTSNAEFDRDIALVVLSIDDEGAGLFCDVGQLLERDARPVRCADLDLADPVRISAILRLEPNHKTNPTSPPIALRTRLPADRRLDHCLNIRHRETVARARLTVHGNRQIGLPEEMENAEVLNSCDLL